MTVVAMIVFRAATGFPAVRLSNCAPPNAAPLGPRDTELTAASGGSPMRATTSQLFSGLVVAAVYGASSLPGDSGSGYRLTPNWVERGEELPVFHRGASGSEAVRYDGASNRCEAGCGSRRPGEMGAK